MECERSGAIHNGYVLTMAQFKVVVCGDCGLARFFVEPSALAKLPKARAWRHMARIGN